ncbi:MAG: DUF6029 family protein [candidate division WOR-3 bacterium]
MVTLILAQVFFTGSTDIQYWKWRSSDDERLQSIFDAALYLESWEVGGKFLYLQPNRPNFPRYEDLTQRYAAYNSDAISARGGSYYASFGRGLVLASVRDDQLMLDRWLEGGDVRARLGPFEGEFLSGTKREIYYYDFKKDQEHTLRAGRLSFVGLPHLNLTGVYARVNWPQYDSTYKQEFISGSAELASSLVSVYGELVRREGFYVPYYYAGDSTPDSTTTSYYAAVSLGLPRFNILLESKDYNLLGNGFNNPPPINHYGVYLTDSIDEAGHGITLNANPIEGLTLTGHRSLSERSIGSQRVEENYFLASYRRTGLFRATAKLDHILVNGVLREIYNDSLEALVTKRAEMTPGAEAVLYFMGKGSLTLSYDHRIRRDIYPYYADTVELIDTLDYFDGKLKLGVGWGPWGSLWFGRTERRETGGERLGVWQSVELSVHLNERLDAMVFYGSQPAGVICSGGICRTEPEFEGIKLWLIGRF